MNKVMLIMLALALGAAACKTAHKASVQGVASSSCSGALPTADIDVRILRQGQSVEVSTEYLGNGSTGVAYTFTEPSTKQEKVLKLASAPCLLMSQETEAFTTYRQSLLQETGRAREAADYLVSTEEATAVYNGTTYRGLVKDFVSGPTALDVVLANIRQDTMGALTADANINAAFDRMYFAVREAYIKGYAIRDLKDDNIIVQANGKPIIIDALAWSSPVSFAKVAYPFAWMRVRLGRDPMSGDPLLSTQGLGKGPGDAFPDAAAYVLLDKPKAASEVPSAGVDSADRRDTPDANAGQDDAHPRDAVHATGR